MNWAWIICSGVGVSVLLTLIVMPYILHISFEKRLFDRPDKRKIHNGVIPRLGGFAFMPVMLVTLGMFLAFIQGGGWPGVISLESLQSVFVAFGAMTVLFFVGLVDDLIGLRYFSKMGAQALAAAILLAGGVVLTDYGHLFGLGQVGYGWGALISFFLILYIINAINLIDGIDGLASGLVAEALIVFGSYFYITGAYFYSLVAWVATGTVAVFWCFNALGSKKRHTKIFMGDIGSLTLGLLIAFLVIVLAGVGMSEKEPDVALIVALSPLVLPLFDVIRVFIVRLCTGKSPFLPDKGHIHHLLLATGLKAPLVMIAMLLIQAGIFLLDYGLAENVEINVIMGIDAGIYLLLVAVALLLKKRTQ